MLLSEIDVIIFKTQESLKEVVAPLLEARRVFVIVEPHKINHEDSELAKLKTKYPPFKNVFTVPIAKNISSAAHVLATVEQLNSLYGTLSEKFLLIENDSVAPVTQHIRNMLSYDEIYQVKPMLVHAVNSSDEKLPALAFMQKSAEVYATGAVNQRGKTFRASGIFLICASCLETNLPILLAATHNNGVQLTVEPVKIYDLLHYFSNVGIAATLFFGEL